MRKKILIFVSALSISALCAACGNQTNNEKNTTKTEATTHIHTDSEGNTVVHAEGDEETTKASQDNKKSNDDKNSKVSDEQIKAGQSAVDIIKEFSAKKLKLDGKLEDYKFLSSTNEKEIDGKKYIEVVASVVNKENEDGTVNMITKGTYYVSPDGKTVLIKNMKTGKTKELKK